MDLYGRPAPRRTSSPAVTFLNERPKSQSLSSGLKPPGVGQGRTEDEVPQNILSDRPSLNQLQQQQTQHHPPILHQRSISSRFLDRPQSSSGVRRPESFAVPHKTKQRPRTARDGVRTLPTTTPTFVKKSSCFTQADTESPEVDDQENGEELTNSSPTLDEQYLLQLKVDILHLHNIHHQLQNEASENDSIGTRLSQSTATSATQAPNHVKNLLLHRDTKTYPEWKSKRNMDLTQTLGTSSSTGSIQTQLLRYNYSSDPNELAAAKVGLEGLLAEKLISLMEFGVDHGASDVHGSDSVGSDSVGAKDFENAFKLKLVRLPTRQHGDTRMLQFANGCGTSPVSIYAQGMLSVLQQTEVLKRSMLASTGEKKILLKLIADKDAQLSRLTEQIGLFKDALARRRPRYEKIKRIHVQDEEREQKSNFDPAENENADQSKLILAVDQVTRLTALEKDLVESILSTKSLQKQKDELEQQLGMVNIEMHGALQRLEIAEQLHQATMTEANKSFQKQVGAMEKRATELQCSLVSIVERYRSLEDASAQEKSQLRRDKQELERLIRLKEDEAGQRQIQATAKAEAQANAATTQLKLVTRQLSQAQQALNGLRHELKAAQLEKNQIQSTIRSLHHDLKVRNEDVERLSSKLVAANATAAGQTELLQQSEARVEATSKEIECQQVLLEEQAQQVQLLEAKLSRSVPVDDEELQSRQQRQESTWHQRVSALEHALVAERQNTALFQEQQRKAVVMEQEKAAHAVEQAQAVAAELATANLCLLERKRQREQERQAFEEKLTEYTDQVAGLLSDKSALERDLEALRSQHEHIHQLEEQSVNEAAATVKKLQEELVWMKGELKNLTEIRENLDRALAHALASSRGKSVRHQASLAELRVELQKAKQKTASLEEQLSLNSCVRTSEIHGKLAQLNARERRIAEEQRGLKKQRASATTERLQIEKERAELEQQRESQERVGFKQKTDQLLLQQTIVLLAHRLQVTMALFDTEPVPVLEQSHGAPSSPADPNATVNPAPEDTERWRQVQQQWEALRQELQNVDWKLENMPAQLEALRLEYVRDSLTPCSEKQELSRSSLVPGFYGPNPFSDAVAAGRDTVPVAEQLKASHLLRRLSCPGESLESRARQVKAEEHETFALALAREMTVMKESYERQLKELRGELHKTKQLRLLTSQRLRAEFATECGRSQQAVAQLTERIAELEAALLEQEKALSAVRIQQQTILD